MADVAERQDDAWQQLRAVRGKTAGREMFIAQDGPYREVQGLPGEKDGYQVTRMGVQAVSRFLIEIGVVGRQRAERDGRAAGGGQAAESARVRRGERLQQAACYRLAGRQVLQRRGGDQGRHR
ncbi:MAG: hypothetical protein ACRDGS_10645, partial [Chloroflexota bacterium]